MLRSNANVCRPGAQLFNDILNVISNMINQKNNLRDQLRFTSSRKRNQNILFQSINIFRVCEKRKARVTLLSEQAEIFD